MRLLRAAPVVFLLAVSTWACSDYVSTGTTPTPTPTPIPPALITETFTGTVSTGGQVYHVFNVKNAGRVDATLTDIGGSSTQQVGFAIGVASVLDPNNVGAPGNLLGCSLVLVNESATKGISLITTASTSLIVCLRVYDPSASVITADTPYTLTVTHY
jgi:hypothetical protein